MDYSILKTIEPLPYYMFPTQRRFDLPSNPHIDYINPGVGLAAKSFNLYIPVYANRFRYNMSKKDPICSETAPNNAVKQGGSGNENIDFKNDSDIISSEMIPSNSNTKGHKRLNEGILDSFKHPKIKTAKLVFETSKADKPISSKSKKIAHNFSVV